jgi:hypothetical protein
MAEKIAPNQITPNQFSLEGSGVRIGYSTSSIAGSAQLSFTKGRKTLSFTGNDIGVRDTPIGALITITIDMKPDQNFTTFSFLLPRIDLAKESAKQAFKTLGITTVHKTTLLGPPKGVQQTYKSIELGGTAQRVQFLTQKAAKA